MPRLSCIPDRSPSHDSLETGEQAQVYANHFIGVHLQEIAGGQTYAQVSAKAQANPTDTKLAGQVQTLFRGETLRGLLLNAYGWWTIGTYALYAAIGLAVAAFAVANLAGIGATALDFGGWKEPDWRAGIFVFLCVAAALAMVRLVRLSSS